MYISEKTDQPVPTHVLPNGSGKLVPLGAWKGSGGVWLSLLPAFVVAVSWTAVWQTNNKINESFQGEKDEGITYQSNKYNIPIKHCCFFKFWDDSNLHFFHHPFVPPMRFPCFSTFPMQTPLRLWMVYWWQQQGCWEIRSIQMGWKYGQRSPINWYI